MKTGEDIAHSVAA